jgi:hypothetical protein
MNPLISAYLVVYPLINPGVLQSIPISTLVHLYRKQLVLDAPNLLLEPSHLYLQPSIASHLCLQRSVPRLVHCFVNNRPVTILIAEDVNPLSGQLHGGGLGVVNRGSMNLTTVDWSLHAHMGLCERVWDFEVYFDISSWCFHPLLVEDIEGNVGSPAVVLVALQWQ